MGIHHSSFRIFTIFVNDKIWNMFFEDILDVYQENEHPALSFLIQKWAKTKPFKNRRILIATPIFRNTMVQYETFIASEAQISIGQDSVLYDTKIVDTLKSRGISVVSQQDVLEQEQNNLFFDIILDCAGQFSSCHPQLGFVELTRSGVYSYEKSNFPIYLADSGLVKQIETSLGTGDGYFRALAKYGYATLKDKKMLVFGSGKVGYGIAIQGRKKGCNVTVVTNTNQAQTIDSIRTDFYENLKEKSFQIIDYKDFDSIVQAILQTDYIVTATGIKSALNQTPIIEAIKQSNAIVANMGVEDEYGENIPNSRVLNQKGSLNFVLEEPTHLKYIDASLALHALLAEQLLIDFQNNNNSVGIKNPPQQLEKEILDITIQKGTITSELQDFFKGIEL